MTPEEQVIAFLRKRKVEEFWIDSAMGYVRRALNGNAHFATKITDLFLAMPRGQKHVKLLAFKIEAELPDQGRTTTGNVIYTFDRKRPRAHNVDIRLV